MIIVHLLAKVSGSVEMRSGLQPRDDKGNVREGPYRHSSASASVPTGMSGMDPEAEHCISGCVCSGWYV